MAKSSAWLALVSILLLVLARGPRAMACFHTLRRPPYETYWLGTYHDSRILSLTCLALRGFRWTLKLIKVTYDGWQLEMDFAQCISQGYGMNIPFINPPWRRTDNRIEDKVSSVNEPFMIKIILPNKHYYGVPVIQNNGLNTSSFSKSKNVFHEGRSNRKNKEDEDIFVTNLQPLVNHKDRSKCYFSVNESNLINVIHRIIKSLYNAVLTLLHALNDQLSKALGESFLSCTHKYAKKAFWRWVDSAPFLK